MVNKSRFAMENELLDVPEDPVTFFYMLFRRCGTRYTIYMPFSCSLYIKTSLHKYCDGDSLNVIGFYRRKRIAYSRLNVTYYAVLYPPSSITRQGLDLVLRLLCKATKYVRSEPPKAEQKQSHLQGRQSLKTLTPPKKFNKHNKKQSTL
jgi:hypothetical protein